MTSKLCAGCGVYKVYEAFSKNKTNKTGYQSWCKECRHARYLRHRQNEIQQAVVYKQNNRESARKNRRAWNKRNPDKVKAIRLRKQKRAYRDNPTFRLSKSLRRRAHHALCGNYKTTTTKALLGCTWAEARVYIEAQFKPGMSWDNYANDTWHIDHIRPLASFDLTDPEQQKQAFHYTNLQPLWAHENLAKGAKFEQPPTG